MPCLSKKIVNNDTDLKRILFIWHRFNDSWEEMIREKFENADNIINLIKSKGDNITLADLSIKEAPKEESQIKTVNQFAKRDTLIDINYNGDRFALNKMFRTFKRKMLGVTIFNLDDNESVNPNAYADNDSFENALNESIYAYKTELLNDIWACVEPGRKFVFTHPALFLNEMNEACAKYAAYKGDHNEAFLKARDAYSILKNFDELLASQAPYIKPKTKYKHNSEAFDKYDYKGANIEMFKTWTTKEEVDIEGQMSDLVSTVIENFSKFSESGNAIPDSILSVAEFNATMALFKDWVLTKMTPDDVNVSGTNAETDLNNLRNAALRIGLDQNINGDGKYESADTQLKRVLDAFVNYAKKGKVKGIDLGTILGIAHIFNSNLDQTIKNCLYNLMFKTDKNRGIILSRNPNDNKAITVKPIEDNYKSSAVYHIQDCIKGSIDKFRFRNQAAFEKLKEKFKISVSNNTIHLTVPGVPHDIIFRAKFEKDRINIEYDQNGGVDNKLAIDLIESVLGTSIYGDYESILAQLSDNGSTKGLLLKTFAAPIAIVLFNSYIPKSNESFTNLFDEKVYWNNGRDDILKSEFKPTRLSTLLSRATDFFALSWGVNTNSVQRNSYGNNVASYTLTSMINQMPRCVINFERRDSENVFKDNFLYKQFLQYVGKPCVRIDANIDGNKKTARNLSVGELAYTSIITEFFNAYKNFKTGDYIYLQNSCFSDKNTHWLIPYHKDLKIGGYTLNNLLNNILNTDKTKRNSAIKVFTDEIYNTRKLETTRILNKLAISYYDVIKENQDALPELTIYLSELAGNSKSKVTAVYNIINLLSDKNLLSRVKQAFANSGQEFIEEFHISKNGFNETLAHDIKMYVLGDYAKFENRIKEQQNMFLKNLHENGFSFDDSVDPETYSKLSTSIGSEWFDSITGEMLLEKNGEMNPLLQAYYLSDVLLSNSYNDLLFGKTYFHPNKYKPNDEEIAYKQSHKGKWPESYYIASEASRLGASFKRTVIAGATTHTFYPMKFGVDSDIRYSVIEDYPANVFTMLGVSAKMDSMDGSGWASPIQSILENMSLLDAKVGYDKKTIFGDVDPKTGCPKLLKWAVYSITNERRRKSAGSDIKGDVLFKKMHNDKFDKTIDISRYYDPINQNEKFVDGHNITEIEYVYRYDETHDKYFRIDKILPLSGIINASHTYQIYESEVDKKGNVLVSSENTEPRVITLNTINAIDAMFGGAYAMQLNKESNTLEDSDVNNRIAANIVCAENLKQYMISYLVNKSGIKVGASNVNSKSSWINNDEKSTDFNLSSSKMSLMFGGVQMDADHVLSDETDVTEMSQMISSLIQSGLYTDEVNAIYSEIGNVVYQSLKQKNMLFYEGDFEKLHQILGKEFLDSFSSNDRDTMGLAQAFLTNIAAKLKENPNAKIMIPFSDPTTIKIFNSTMVSNLNKKGIKRKYAGIASVQVPSRGMIQYFDFEGQTMTYPTLCRKLREAKQNNPTKYANVDPTQIGTYVSKVFNINNPFIKPITSKTELDMGDTVFTVDSSGNISSAICLDTWENYDAIKHLSDDSIKIYKHTLASHDLRGSDITFKVDGKTYSIYDLDSVRAVHYINKLKKGIALTDAERKVVALATGMHPDLTNPDNLYTKAINSQENDLRLLDEGLYINYNSSFEPSRGTIYGDFTTVKNEIILNNSPEDLLKLFDDVYINRTHGIPIKDIFDSFVKVYPKLNADDLLNAYNLHTQMRISDVNTRAAEIIMGRVNKDQLGLRGNDDIADITDAQFFVNRIKESEQMIDSNIDKNSYDAVLKGANGENLYIRIASNHMNIDPVTGKKIPGYLQQNWILDENSFEEVDGDIYHNGKYVCSGNGKIFYSSPGVNSTNYMVELNDWSEINELLDSDQYNYIMYNYTRNNIVDLIINQGFLNAENKFVRPLEFHTQTGTIQTGLNSNKPEYSITTKIDVGTNIFDINLQQLINLFNTEEIYRRELNIERLATNKFIAFQKQLEFIGARIPTQSMQSFSRMRVVGYTNSLYNEVYLPAQITWLQGSDYDIDKLYLMGYELSSKGSFVTFSKLINDCNNIQEVNQVLKLPKPNGIEYYKNNEEGYLIDKNACLNALKFKDLSALEGCLKHSKGRVAFTDDISEKQANAFIRMLNKHSLSKTSNYNSEIALRNSVVEGIINILKHPRLAPYAHQSVDDSMDEFKQIAKASFLATSESTMTSDNPLVKYIMQMQNMVGKDVIGITAVGMKVFFATTTATNLLVEKLVKAAKLGDFNRSNNSVEQCWKELTFVDPITSEKRMLANINLEPIFNLDTNILEKIKDVCPQFDNVVKNTKRVNAASLISGLLSAATDNAKELILSKINATNDFADAWTFLISEGTPVNEIKEIMMSKSMSLVQRYSKSNLFSNINATGDKQSAINFILGLSNLSGINNRDLKLLLGSYRTNKKTPDNKCFIDKLIYEINENGELIKDVYGNYIQRTKPLVDPKIAYDEKTGAFVKESPFRRQLIDLLIGITNPETGEINQHLIQRSIDIATELEKHIRYLLKTTASERSVSKETDYDEDANMDERIAEEAYQNAWEESSYMDNFDDIDVYDENQEAFQISQAVDFGEADKFKVSEKSLKTILKYLKHYLIPKNNELKSITSEDITSLKIFNDRIIPNTNEQAILGAMLGINQGLKTNLNDFLKLINRINNFVNERIPIPSDGSQVETFDIIKFLCESDSYKQYWINKYETLKSSKNILSIITTTPNFASMFQEIAVAHGLFQHSIQNRLDIKLSKAILEYNNPGSSRTKRLNDDEFAMVDDYVRRLILQNWLLKQNNLNLIITKGDRYYHKDMWGNEVLMKNESDEPLQIKLNTFEGQATFVNYFENKLIDLLKERYKNRDEFKAFFSNLTTSPILNKVYQQKTNHLKLAINSMIADKNIQLSILYSNISKAYSLLAKEQIPELDGMTFGDALFLYNSLVYKNGYTEKGFTRLLENSMDSRLNQSYRTFIANADANAVEGSSDVLKPDENGHFQWGVIEGNINDLLYKFAFKEKTAQKFKVKLVADATGARSTMQFVDMFGNEILDENKVAKQPISVGVVDANDWTSGMPCLTSDYTASSVKPAEENYNIPKCFRYNSETVVRAVLDNFAGRMNLKIGEHEDSDIILFDSRDLPSYSKYKENPDAYPIKYKNYNDWIRIQNSSAFWDNGKLYVNTYRATVDTTVHELMHLYCAGLKFSNDEKIRAVYYNALNSIMELYKEKYPKEYSAMKEAYKGDVASDFKEELLTNFLSNIFATSFRTQFGAQKWVSDLTSEIINVIDKCFNTEIPKNINKVKLGNTCISDFMAGFNSNLFDVDNNMLRSRMILDQQMKTIKRILIDNADDPTKKCKIEYDC